MSTRGDDAWVARLEADWNAERTRRMRSERALNYLRDQYGFLLQAHEQVVMDTSEDRELHDRVIMRFREVLDDLPERND